ncbi:MAG TPA: acylphosphatase [Mesorhizobium sp.]|jgi:acylphosphatase|uniref:acylphosphatase n=1 Tax=Mesorhizobium sp. TaxID=1871066 RepID=UPI002DDD0D16|nr:acylphosphatase [Mesorhizobium sp.]HEV2502897.1 acylphosphatase [Mesorhizobium sp.]
MSASDRAAFVRIAGRVQGVGFRAWTQRRAISLGLRGWVRNEPDGSVSALVAGSGEALAAMLNALWQGPAGAGVTSVEPKPADPTDAPADFDITG